MNTYALPPDLVDADAALGSERSTAADWPAANFALARAPIEGGEIEQAWSGLRWNGARTIALEWPVRPLGAPFDVLRVRMWGRSDAVGGFIELRSATVPGVEVPGALAGAVVAWEPPVGVVDSASPEFEVTIDPDDDRLVLRLEGDGDDVHLSRIVAERVPVASPVGDAFADLHPFGTGDSIGEGRPYHAGREQALAETIEGVSARPGRMLINISAVREPVAAYCGELATLPELFSEVEQTDAGSSRPPGWAARLRNPRVDGWRLAHGPIPRGIGGVARYGSGAEGGRLLVGRSDIPVDPAEVVAWRDLGSAFAEERGLFLMQGMVMHRASVEARSPVRPADLPAAQYGPAGDIKLQAVAIWERGQ